MLSTSAAPSEVPDRAMVAPSRRVSLSVWLRTAFGAISTPVAGVEVLTDSPVPAPAPFRSTDGSPTFQCTS